MFRSIGLVVLVLFANSAPIFGGEFKEVDLGAREHILSLKNGGAILAYPHSQTPNNPKDPNPSSDEGPLHLSLMDLRAHRVSQTLDVSAGAYVWKDSPSGEWGLLIADHYYRVNQRTLESERWTSLDANPPGFYSLDFVTDDRLMLLNSPMTMHDRPAFFALYDKDKEVYRKNGSVMSETCSQDFDKLIITSMSEDSTLNYDVVGLDLPSGHETLITHNVVQNPHSGYFLPDGNSYFTFSRGIPELVETKTGTVIKTFQFDSSASYVIPVGAQSATPRYLFAGLDGVEPQCDALPFQILDFKTGASVFRKSLCSNDIGPVFSNDHEHLTFLASDRGKIEIWRIRDQTLEGEVDVSSLMEGIKANVATFELFLQDENTVGFDLETGSHLWQRR